MTTKTSFGTNLQARTTSGTNNTFKGKSKYAQKKRQQQNKLLRKASRGPVNEYPCTCHGEPAKKEALKHVGLEEAKKATVGVGKWRCSVTGKRTTVTVRKAAPKVEAPVAVPSQQV